MRCHDDYNYNGYNPANRAICAYNTSDYFGPPNFLPLVYSAQAVIGGALLGYCVSKISGIGNPKGAAIAMGVNALVNCTSLMLLGSLDIQSPLLLAVPMAISVYVGSLTAKKVTALMGCEVKEKTQVALAALSMVPALVGKLPGVALSIVGIR